MPLVVRNTFFEVVARQPESFDEFITERKVQSSPPTVQTKSAEEVPTSTCIEHTATPSSSSTASPETSHACCLPSVASIAAPCARFGPLLPPHGSDYTGFVPSEYSSYPHEALEYLHTPSNMGAYTGVYARASPSAPLARRATTSGAGLAVASSAPDFVHHREARAPLIPGLVSASLPICSGHEGRRTSGPSLSRGLLLAATADEPAEHAESSSNEDGPQEVERIVGSDTAELGSPLCPTLGSRGHSLHMCKPCAFILKGCQSGVECKFCHLCEVGEKKRRKKEKIVFRREMNKWRQALTPTSSWKPGGFW